MSNNNVVSLPDGILDLSALEELNLAGNKLKDLPKVRAVERTLTVAAFRGQRLCPARLLVLRPSLLSASDSLLAQ
eukprot:COSAG02_NODE_1598_length_11761_cov_15.902418_11_plen_75_part_00